MTQIRLDDVYLTSFVDTFLNYRTEVGSISISGSISNGDFQTFQTSVSPNITADGVTKVMPEIYAKNLNTNRKMSVTAGVLHNPYQAASTELAEVYYSIMLNNTFPELSKIFVFVFIQNSTGSTINLVNQTWEITAVLQQVPY